MEGTIMSSSQDNHEDRGNKKNFREEINLNRGQKRKDDRPWEAYIIGTNAKGKRETAFSEQLNT